ncbi:MAG: ABC transporter substrate-binding protein [Candidatus Poribacteria bacterium]|nr:ABC transporter substrate-binding protein [Candidatus Poribacteria bacterium]MDE0322375.1 ABC transporter substrate-binding protein [Candidatus Poribacteria bacterium]
MRDWLVGLLIIGLVSVWGCQPASRDTQTTQGEVRVAVAGPFTGNAAAFGEMIKRGAELRAKHINDAGGINGMKLTLVPGDDAGTEKEARAVATRFATDRRILAVVGHFNSACSLAGKPIYADNGIVELSPGSTNVSVCEGSDWTFRNLYRDDFQGEFIANYIKNYMKEFQSVAILFDNDDYGRGLRDGFSAAAEEIGIEIVASEAYDRDNTDFKAQLTSIKAKNPDLIFISGLYGQAGLIAKQAREAGITAQFFGADGVDSPDYLIIAGPAAEGTYLTTPFTFELGGEQAKQVASSFESEYGVPPDTWAALTYDAVGMIAEAIEKTYNREATLAENRKAIRDHLASLDTPEEGYKGITGLTYFDKNGDTVNKPAYVKIVKDGQFATAPDQVLD